MKKTDVDEIHDQNPEVISKDRMIKYAMNDYR